MIVGIGNDLANITRVQAMQAKLPKTVNKILTPAEIAVFEKMAPKRQGEFLAGRFSAKESYSKALGTGIGKHVSFLELEILNDSHGRPYFAKHPLKDECIAHISITHTDHHVATMVVLEKRENR
ncbi:holo-ACP synthase [Ligilactobacillus apodemi]|uniref:Holo-[acyl-carrier-protein] synthase n=1 Tax=Ligilactobacillus apodemi DSM 16634 = JCM 16172 TaxID=1423724 RepID=A0A0R1U408_9LACO|nr:holo-ACP synthase [Ligilactobacillus apodemi]KRL85682.1 4-phosphopantetheinyl transferase [Ligilactobacillus apodemi DSM 16634 = JCM 16172]MCR1900996.1 holo-ACP synthase [Ligilactobacillus apodemi]